jgi:hypothetical protein
MGNGRRSSAARSDPGSARAVRVFEPGLGNGGTGVASHCSFPEDALKWAQDRLPPFRAGQTTATTSPVLRTRDDLDPR